MRKQNNGWIGVDLDSTLALYDGWVRADHIGKPVPLMLQRVKQWLAQGQDVRIFTARVGPQKDPKDAETAAVAIRDWCKQHVGQVLPITATKDFACIEIWDDRCVAVQTNTGVVLAGVSEDCL